MSNNSHNEQCHRAAPQLPPMTAAERAEHCLRDAGDHTNKIINNDINTTTTTTTTTTTNSNNNTNTNTNTNSNDNDSNTSNRQ